MFILNIATRVNKTSLIKETYTNSLLYTQYKTHQLYTCTGSVTFYLSKSGNFLLHNILLHHYQSFQPKLILIRESVLHFLCWISLNCYFSNSINIYHYTVQMEIFVPILLSSHSSSLSVDKFMTGKIHIYFTTLLIRRRIYDTSTIPSGELQKGQNHLQL